MRGLTILAALGGNWFIGRCREKIENTFILFLLIEKSYISITQHNKPEQVSKLEKHKIWQQVQMCARPE